MKRAFVLARYNSSVSCPSPATGLAGVIWAVQPSSLARAGEAARIVCDTLVAHVERDMAGEAGSRGAGLHTLHQLDAISNTLCSVLDLAEFVRQNSADAEWRRAAESVYRRLGSYMHALNAHRPLYAALVALTRDDAAMHALSPSQRRMAYSLQSEFEKDGIHLPDEARSALVALNDAAAEAAGDFVGGIGAAPAPAVVVRRAGTTRKRWARWVAGSRPVLCGCSGDVNVLSHATLVRCR